MRRLFTLALLFPILYILSSPHAASGQHGVDPAWGSEVALPKVPGGAAGGNLGPTIATKPDGTIVVLFREVLGGSLDVYLTRSTDGGNSWSMPSLFPPITSVGGGPVIACDLNGFFHVIWSEQSPSAIYHSKSSDGVIWSMPSAPISATATYRAEGPIITIDQLDRIHVFWYDGDTDPSAGMPPECYYLQSVDGGLTWTAQQRLSADDGAQSAFPRADLTGVMGDTLAVMWRDTREDICGEEFDAYMAYSTDGGSTWTERPAFGGGVVECDKEHDPTVLVDQRGWFHASYSFKPEGNYILGSRVRYARSTDLGATWGEGTMLSDDVESDFSYSIYDPVNDLIWQFWQDYRDAVPPDPKKDLMGRYSWDAGANWSNREFITDAGDHDVGFPGYVPLPNGAVLATYAHPIGTDSTTCYFRRRLPVDPTGVASVPESAVRLRLLPCSPNPTTGSTWVRFTLPTSDIARVRVFDVGGRLKQNLINGFLPAGRHRVALRTKDWTPGVYFVQVQTRGETRGRKLVIAR
jgi:hypothetical protein